MKPGNDNTYILYLVTWTDNFGNENQGKAVAKSRKEVQRAFANDKNVLIKNVGTAELY